MLAKSSQFTPRKKKWVILLALCGLSSYGMYKVYNLPSVSRNRKRLAKLLGALIAITEMLSDSSETLSLVSRDLKEFLASENDQVPNSLKQLSKIAMSNEVSKTLSGVSEAVTLGVIQGYKVDEIEKVEDSSFKDHVMDKLMSKPGTGFVSVVVGSFARNLVLGFNSNGNYESGLTQWVGVLSKDESKLVIGDLIKTIVSTAVATYLDRATSVNVYDDNGMGRAI
nr:protein phloem protein 2-like A10 [Tanacetum cinerariifolium]